MRKKLAVEGLPSPHLPKENKKSRFNSAILNQALWKEEVKEHNVPQPMPTVRAYQQTPQENPFQLITVIWPAPSLLAEEIIYEQERVAVVWCLFGLGTGRSGLTLTGQTYLLSLT